MKFLLQQGVLLDFIFAIQKAKEWWDWWKPKEGIVEFVDSGCSKDICPIGSLEFCLDYYKSLGITLKPLNVPENLTPDSLVALKNVKFQGASVKMMAEAENRINSTTPHGWYIKSETKFKYPKNGFYSTIYDFLASDVDKDDEYQFAIFRNDIESEWRIFVYEGELVGAKCYSSESIYGCPLPDSGWVKDIAKRINLPAYTLDVAVLEGGMNVVMEVHDLFSCGLYGFDDYNKIPYMFYRSHLHKFL